MLREIINENMGDIRWEYAFTHGGIVEGSDRKYAEIVSDIIFNKTASKVLEKRLEHQIKNLIDDILKGLDEESNTATNGEYIDDVSEAYNKLLDLKKKLKISVKV